MAGLYLHIPFCSSKCHYCNFFSTVSLKRKKEFLEAVHLELIQQKNYLPGQKIETVYFGGGTPSLLNINELESIFKVIRNHYSLSDGAEITLEANPDDVNPAVLKQWKNLGVNRLSIGTQAFDDSLLQSLNRRHTAAQSVIAVKEARDAGFENISIDLIYAIPGLTHDLWTENIQKALSLNVPHLSAYHLTVEPGTALEVLIRKKKFPAVDDDRGMQQFDLLMKMTEAAGFEHYEISNFARNKNYSKHNSSYWQDLPYLGVGPSAHSYNRHSRRWNVARLQPWIDGIKKHKPAFEEEILTKADRYNEMIMLGLRTMWGVDSQKIKAVFGEKISCNFEEKAQKWIQKNLMKKSDNRYTLTREGKKLADGIALDFFIDNL